MEAKEAVALATFISAAGTIVSAVVAMIGLWIAYSIHQNQQKLTAKINDSQQLLAQRQLLVPLWGYISALNEIDPQRPITPDVVKAVNTLELIALCCEGAMIDEKVIKRTFSQGFISLYRQVESCIQIPGLNKTGKELLLEAKAASLFYKKLENEHLTSNLIN